MRLPNLNFFAFLLMGIFLSLTTQAQDNVGDSTVVPAGYSTALQQYHSYLTPESRLYRGGQYVEYAFQFRDGHPFFGEGQLRSGTVEYDGIHYTGLQILFDEVKDMLVIPDADRVFKIALINAQVDSFTIEQHHFIRLKDSLNPMQPRNGYYELLYHGNITLLKRENKTIQEDLSSPAAGVQRYILTSVSYYYKKGDIYHAVNNSGSLMHVLADRARDLKKFMRKNNLSVRKDKENTLLQVFAWYDSQR